MSKGQPVPDDDLPQIASKAVPTEDLPVAGKLEAPKYEGWGSLLDKAAYKIGGSATDVLAGKVPPEVAGAAGFVANVATQAAPSFLGAMTGSMAEKPVDAVAHRLMQSSLKPGVKAMASGKGQAAIDTLLKEGINVTPGGMTKLRGKIDVLNDAVDKAIASSGATVDKGVVASRIQDVVKKIERTNPTPQDALKDVEKVYNQFMSNQILPNQIPVQQMQEIKRGIYGLLREKYGFMGRAEPAAQALNALGYGSKEEIAKAIPGIAELNAKESALLNALVLGERRVATAGNSNPFSLSLLAKNPGAMVAFLADKSDMFKSIIARILHSQARTIPATAGAAIGGTAGAIAGVNKQE
jgi:hypothetical protein